MELSLLNERIHVTLSFELLLAETKLEKTANILQPYQGGSQLFNYRAVIKRRGQGFPLGAFKVAPGYFHRKIEPKESKVL